MNEKPIKLEQIQIDLNSKSLLVVYGVDHDTARDIADTIEKFIESDAPMCLMWLPDGSKVELIKIPPEDAKMEEPCS